MKLFPAACHDGFDGPAESKIVANVMLNVLSATP